MDTWDPDCPCAVFFLMSRQTHISFCPKLIEIGNEPFWCLLAVRLPSPAHPLSSFLNLSFFIPYFSVSVFSPAGTGSQSASPQRLSCHFPTGLIKGSKQCSPHSSNKHQFFFSQLSGAKVRRIMGEIGAQERRMMDLPSYHCFFFSFLQRFCLICSHV